MERAAVNLAKEVRAWGVLGWGGGVGASRLIVQLTWLMLSYLVVPYVEISVFD
jgi:Flp pilus assembly CpaE family ATPase